MHSEDLPWTKSYRRMSQVGEILYSSLILAWAVIHKYLYLLYIYIYNNIYIYIMLHIYYITYIFISIHSHLHAIIMSLWLADVEYLTLDDTRVNHYHIKFDQGQTCFSDFFFLCKMAFIQGNPIKIWKKYKCLCKLWLIGINKSFSRKEYVHCVLSGDNFYPFNFFPSKFRIWLSHVKPTKFFFCCRHKTSSLSDTLRVTHVSQHGERSRIHSLEKLAEMGLSQDFFTKSRAPLKITGVTYT